MRNRACLSACVWPVRRGFLALPLLFFFGACSPDETGTKGVSGTGGAGPVASGGAGGLGTSGGASATGGRSETGGAGPSGSGGLTVARDAGIGGADAQVGSGGRGAGGGSGGATSSDAGASDTAIDSRPGSGGVSGSGGQSGSGGRAGSAGAAGRSGAGGAAGAGGRASTGGAGGAPVAGGPVTVFIAGDSTVSTYAANAANKQAGWGQMLPEFFSTQVKISNQAIGGRSSRRFINEGRLTTIVNAMKPGDYLLVQFGTNDGNTTATYDDGEPYYVSTTDFQTYMGQFIDGARSKQGIPVLVTPPPRASCTGDEHSVGNGLLGYANAMKTVATAKSAALVDLNAATVAYVSMIGCVAAKANFYLLNDSTHFQQNGARIMAGFVADGIVTLGLPLAAYRLP